MATAPSPLFSMPSFARLWCGRLPAPSPMSPFALDMPVWTRRGVSASYGALSPMSSFARYQLLAWRLVATDFQRHLSHVSVRTDTGPAIAEASADSQHSLSHAYVRTPSRHRDRAASHHSAFFPMPTFAPDPPLVVRGTLPFSALSMPPFAQGPGWDGHRFRPPGALFPVSSFTPNHYLESRGVRNRLRCLFRAFVHTARRGSRPPSHAHARTYPFATGRSVPRLPAFAFPCLRLHKPANGRRKATWPFSYFRSHAWSSRVPGSQRFPSHALIRTGPSNSQTQRVAPPRLQLSMSSSAHLDSSRLPTSSFPHLVARSVFLPPMPTFALTHAFDRTRRRPVGSKSRLK